MDYTLDSEIVLIETKKINKYKYVVSNLIPHTSIHYDIYCFDDKDFIKQISGLFSTLSKSVSNGSSEKE